MTSVVAGPVRLDTRLDARWSWWVERLLALPHKVILAFFVGGGSYVAIRGADTSGSWGPRCCRTGVACSC